MSRPCSDSVLVPEDSVPRVRIMGILNVTPDSFSDGGHFIEPKVAAERAMQMAEEGADLIDIGAESTRPGAEPVDAQTELERLIPVIESVRQSVDRPISVDTYKATVARRAIEAGAMIVNDIHGFQGDPEMAAVVAATGAACILMHNPPSAHYPDGVLADIRRFFEKSLRIADEAGIPRSRIALDPGIGFKKSPTDNLEILRNLASIRNSGPPLLLGASRKSFIGHAIGLPVGERLEATLAVSVLATGAGVAILRVHDVRPNVRAVRMTEAILESNPSTPALSS